MSADAQRNIESTLGPEESLRAYGSRRHAMPRELDDYRPARHAVAELATRHDSLEVGPLGPQSWKVTARDMPRCLKCQGLGSFFPEGWEGPRVLCPATQCPECHGHGRRRSVVLHVAAVYTIDSEGKVTRQ